MIIWFLLIFLLIKNTPKILKLIFNEIFVNLSAFQIVLYKSAKKKQKILWFIISLHN